MKYDRIHYGKVKNRIKMIYLILIISLINEEYNYIVAPFKYRL